MLRSITLVVNGAPYGTEMPYNAFRLASALVARGATVRIFLMSDAVGAARGGQNVPKGYYDTERMLADLIAKGVSVRLCGTCTEARGLREEEVIEGAAISTMSELAQWVLDSDEVISF